MVNPVVKRILGALVYGEGHSADEGDACERRPDTCKVRVSVYVMRRGNGQHTTVEAMEAFGSVGMSDAVGERVEFVSVSC